MPEPYDWEKDTAEQPETIEAKLKRLAAAAEAQAIIDSNARARMLDEGGHNDDE